ncbi:MAG: ATP-binding cassette domain-containing protein [Treponema sp.]|jgi:ABC-type multidrug transport system ATPase subunit|nr:ATP-binding cassette domain-containing protein [Treponema sp.]
MAAILELKQVTFFAQKRNIVRDFSWEYEEGKATALVGPSGCGKSTILKLSAGLLLPTQGEVCFRGKSVTAMNRKENGEFRREAAMVFQDSALWANQSLYQILELPLRIHFPAMTKPEREERIEGVCAEVGFRKELSIRPALLSMGEQKLIGFARAMLCRPRLLYLDEWTESLDDGSARRLIGIVKRRQAAGDTIIFVSHNLRIIRDIADIILMILGGRLFLRLTREEIAGDEDLMRYVEMGIAS